MCRNIRTLFNFEPPATEDEIRASALQFVQKAQRLHASLEGERGGLRPRRRRGHRDRPKADLLARDDPPAEEPRGRGDEGPRPSGRALRVRFLWGEWKQQIG